MTKTPITDKIKKYLRVIEKVTLANTLDTGFDTSQHTKNWTQAGQDFDKFFGLDNLKKKLGSEDAGQLDVSSYQQRGQAYKNISDSFAYQLFSQMRKTKADLLEVAVASGETATSESLNQPYIWVSNIVAKIILNEDIYPLGPDRNSTFWRDGRSGAIYIKQAKFPGNYFFTPVSGGVYENYMHKANGSAPAPNKGAAGTLVTHLSKNFKAPVMQAIDHVESFVSDKDNKFFLDVLRDSGTIVDLPPLIQDAMVLGALDAANLKIPRGRDQQGERKPETAGILLPTDRTLNTLEVAIDKANLKQENEVYLTEELKNDLIATLTQISNHTGPYADTFMHNLLDVSELKKKNVARKVDSAHTTICFIIANGVNKILKALGGTPPAEELVPLIFGKLGWNDSRIQEFKSVFRMELIDKGCPIVLVRAITGIPNSALRIEYFIVDLAKSSTKEKQFLTQGEGFPASLSTTVHNVMLSKVQSLGYTDNASRKEAYIKEFETIAPNMSSIQGADLGANYWKQILETCYNGDGTFTEGAFFVAVSPLFWDKPTGGNIKTCYDVDIAHKGIELHYVEYDNTGNRTELPEVYKIGSAAELWLDRQRHGSSESRKVLDATKFSDVIKKRNESVISKLQFKSMEDIGKDFMQELYSNEGSIADQQALATLATDKLWKVLKNIQHGFWTIDNSTLLENGTMLAGGDPWSYTSATSRTSAETKRFIKDNTSDNSVFLMRNKELSELMKAAKSNDTTE